jgi:hypothetical protein
MQWHATVGMTPLDEWSALRRNIYLTTHNNHNKQPCRPQSQQASGLLTLIPLLNNDKAFDKLTRNKLWEVMTDKSFFTKCNNTDWKIVSTYDIATVWNRRNDGHKSYNEKRVLIITDAFYYMRYTWKWVRNGASKSSPVSVSLWLNSFIGNKSVPA